jgi:predicted nucleotidyltransferase
MKSNSAIINKIRQVIYTKYPDAEIYLYGSRARGDSKEKSDWDLLILLNSSKISFNIESNIIDDLYELEIDTGEVISPLLYTQKDWYEDYSVTALYENIKKDAIRL